MSGSDSLKCDVDFKKQMGLFDVTCKRNINLFKQFNDGILS
jgi:hypothetical protein